MSDKGGADTSNEQLRAENESLRAAILLLHRVANLVRTAVELDTTYYALLTGATAGVGLGLNRAMLFLVGDEDRNVLRGAAAVGPADSEEADRVWRSIEAIVHDLESLHQAGLDLNRRDRRGRLDEQVRELVVDIGGDSPIALAMRRRGLVCGEGGDTLGGLLDLGTCVAAPLMGRDAIRGVLYADNRFTRRSLSPTSQLVFALVADHAGRAIEGAHRFEQIARDARTDALTGLGHHGALMESLGRMVASGRGRPIGLLMVDLDDFNVVNDTHGHLAGDALLVGVAERMQGVLRAGERPFRYGGDEFTVVLEGADRDATRTIAERLRRAVSDAPFRIGGALAVRVTCSVGAASLPEDAQTSLALVERADEALLAAKSAGKDRVELAAAASPVARAE
jgi:diguanylate cyclase (GGDEF)-like protein